MNTSSYLKYSLYAIAISIIGCATHNESQEDHAFAWDMSVENHTGVANNYYVKDGKHRGMSVFHWRHREIGESINQLVKDNIEAVALIPFLYQKTDTTKTVSWKGVQGKWSRSDSIYIKVSQELHERNMHVMFKPHLWMSEGWRSNIKLETDEEWDAWFDSYEEQMLHYALLSQEMNVDLFCIGTELKSSLKKQPQRWKNFVRKIKDVYDGKLTYASNWDGEYNDVNFWNDMDYIGIQAYYPLTNNISPTLDEIKNGWDKHLKKLIKLSKEFNKPILFTETGYRSDVAATIKPWEWGNSEDTKLNTACNTTQNRAYEALFQKLWNEKWFAGVYFWQWHTTNKENEEYNLTEFTPQYKPAENTMAKWYGTLTEGVR